jgi:SAM-dependent methyltransferase
MRISAETPCMPPALGGLAKGLDRLATRGAMRVSGVAPRLLAIAYGPVHDAVFRLSPWYQALLREVVGYASRSLGASGRAGAPRVLELGSGTGNFSLALAERGYSIVGEEPYEALVGRALKKAAARRLGNVTFRPGPAMDQGYDLLLSVHVLCAHPDPMGELRRGFARLREGGHAIIVNFARRAPVVATAGEVWAGEGAVSALRSLVWLLPNALFERLRGGAASHYWSASEFRTRLEGVGFEVLELRPTFLLGISLLAWCRRGL